MRGLREIDRILRGEATNSSTLAADGLAVPVGPLLAANAALAAVYGVCMGVYALFGRPEPEFRQLLADVVKVPALFLLSLCVTFPSLYVFNALVGSRLGVGDLARLMTAAMAVLLAVLASFGPIVAFFSITTTSYPFVVLLNVAMCAIAAGFGLTFLLRTLEKLTLRPQPPRTVLTRTEAEPALEGESGAEPVRERIQEVRVERPPQPDPAVRAVFRVWIAAFAIVGAQMSWVLRPFIGAPDRPFTWFRPRESSFFEAVLNALRSMLAG
jgi:hypothetical protein